MYKIKRATAGLGLFAMKRFKRGERIVQYIGERIPLSQSRDDAKYLMSLDDDIVIDGKRRDNPGRYLNHSCRPNAEAIIEGDELFIYARRTIEIGAEITIDYGREYWDTFIRPKGCRCLPCMSPGQDLATEAAK